MPSPGSARLTLLEKIGLALGLLLFATLGVFTEIRSCFLKSRMTDFGVYLRAGWAVRTGADLYRITDNNNWHYVYPPAFAVLMTPFADAPAGQSRDGLLPYAASVGLWIVLNFILLVRMAHVLASLALPEESRGSRRWWYARLVPIEIAIGGLGYTISRGQVNVLLLALIVEMIRASVRSKRLRSGLWLAAAIVLKVIPAYLLIMPFVRRDYRIFAGVALGSIIGFAAIPMVGLGVAGTLDAYRSFADRVLMPGAAGKENAPVSKELTDVASTDSQSFLSVIHNNLYPDRRTQPRVASDETRLAHVGCVAILTLAVVAVAWRRGFPTVPDQLIFTGLLTIVMLHATPVSHMHYYALGYPLAAGLWLKGMANRQDRVFPGWRVLLPLTIWGIGTALPLLPGPLFDMARHRGLGLACSLLLISVGLAELGRLCARQDIERESPTVTTVPFQPPELRKAG